MPKFSQALYDKSPTVLQTVFLNLYALGVHKERYGRKFKTLLDELGRSQYFSTTQIDEYQDQLLRQIIKHSYATVSYYRELFDRLKLSPEDIRTKSDLQKLPVLTKDDVRRNKQKLLSTACKRRRLIHGHTSGTTGSPLDVLWDSNVCVYTNALDWRQKMWAGVNPGDRMALLLGRTISPVKRKFPPYWRMNYVHNQLWMSSFHMNDENLKLYVNKLKKFQPVAVEGYPSTVYVLARYLRFRGLTLPVRAVFTSSETIYPIQRETIEQAFECRVFDFYGLAERVIFATECEAHSGRHLNFEYGVTEIVDSEYAPVSRGRTGVVVSTGLQNFGMPLIRYKTSDVSAMRSAPCSCGRSMPRIEDVTTKADDIIVKPDGTMISPSVLTHPFKPMHQIEKSQIIQEDLEHITIKIVKRDGYRNRDTERLLRSFQDRIGADISIHIEFVSDIPRTSAGKYRWVISKVGLNLEHDE